MAVTYYVTSLVYRDLYFMVIIQFMEDVEYFMLLILLFVTCDVVNVSCLLHRVFLLFW